MHANSFCPSQGYIDTPIGSQSLMYSRVNVVHYLCTVSQSVCQWKHAISSNLWLIRCLTMIVRVNTQHDIGTVNFTLGHHSESDVDMRY
jgi:hypothetical protein